MKFHFEFDIKKLSQPITHHHQLFLAGSCFTENIGEKLRKYKFRVMENPNGILFNPVSVAEALVSYIENIPSTADELFQLNDGWHSWKHHSRYSGITAEDALQKINSSRQAAHEYLKSIASLLISAS